MPVLTIATIDPYDAVPRVLDILRKEGACVAQLSVERLGAAFQMTVAFDDLGEDRTKLLQLRVLALHSIFQDDENTAQRLSSLRRAVMQGGAAE